MLPKLRIADLAGLIGLNALGLVMVRGPLRESADFSLVVAPLAASAVLAALMVAVLVARFGDARRRAFAWGFALFGWAYLLPLLHDGRLEGKFRGCRLPDRFMSAAVEPLYELANGRRPFGGPTAAIMDIG